SARRVARQLGSVRRGHLRQRGLEREAPGRGRGLWRGRRGRAPERGAVLLLLPNGAAQACDEFLQQLQVLGRHRPQLVYVPRQLFDAESTGKELLRDEVLELGDVEPDEDRDA